MTLKIKKLVILVVALFFSAQSVSADENLPLTPIEENSELNLENLLSTSTEENAAPIFFMVVPKSGTHMLQKLLGMLRGQSVPIQGSIDLEAPIEITGTENFILQHPFAAFDHYIDSDYKKVLLVRDLRDIFVSLYHFYERFQHHEEYTHLSKKEKIQVLIESPLPYFGMQFYTQQALKWMENQDTLVLHFEDLVGESGGGIKSVSYQP